MYDLLPEAAAVGVSPSYELNQDLSWEQTFSNLWIGLVDPAITTDNATLLFDYLSERVKYLKNQVILNQDPTKGFYNPNLGLITVALAPSLTYLTQAQNAFTNAQVAIKNTDLNTTLENIFSGLFYKYFACVATLNAIYPSSSSELSYLQATFSEWIRNGVDMIHETDPLNHTIFSIPSIILRLRTDNDSTQAFLNGMSFNMSSFSSVRNMAKEIINNINIGTINSNSDDFFENIFNLEDSKII
jgi:hypothetical protein